MASSKYTNARCGQCLYWKASRDPLGTCRVDLEYPSTIGRYSKACSLFETAISMKQLPPIKEYPLIFYKR